MRFLGVDFGWQSQPSGMARLDWDGQALHLKTLDRCATPADALTWIERHAGRFALIAVDAPTRIGNATGMRQADRDTHRRFGQYDAGCYPANLARPFAGRTTGFGQALEQRGFGHAPTIRARQRGRFQIECFPHISTVQLFRLGRILKYKKGLRATRAAELQRLRHLLLTARLDPPLKLSTLPELPARGSLKPLEDQLDALLCAYTGAHWWHWGLERNEVLGEAREGYLIAPHRAGE
jgi:predicted RNase H-like nuclease